MSKAVVLEYSPRVASRWRKAAARWIFNALIILFASAIGAGLGYLSEPTVFQATGLLRVPYSPSSPGAADQNNDFGPDWQNGLQKPEFRFHVAAILKGSITETINHHAAMKPGKTEGVPGARIGSETITSIPGTLLVSIVADSDDAPSAAHAVQLIGDVALNRDSTGAAGWYSEPEIPSGRVHKAVYYSFGAMCGGGLAVLFLLLAVRKRRSVG